MHLIVCTVQQILCSPPTIQFMTMDSCLLGPELTACTTGSQNRACRNYRHSRVASSTAAAFLSNHCRRQPKYAISARDNWKLSTIHALWSLILDSRKSHVTVLEVLGADIQACQACTPYVYDAGTLNQHPCSNSTQFMSVCWNLNEVKQLYQYWGQLCHLLCFLFRFRCKSNEIW